MFFHQQRMMPRVCFAPEGAAGSGTPSGGEAPPAGGAPAGGEAAFETPWSKTEGTYMIGEGDKAKPWYEGITEEPIKEYMKTKNYANPYEAARAAWSANKLLAERGDPNTITVPKADAPKEQWEEFHKKIGRPDSPEGYQFKHPEGVEVDKDLEALGRNIFHKLGVPTAKAQEAIDMWNEAVGKKIQGNTEAARVANETELADLAKTWGADLEKNRAAGERVMKALNLDAAFMAKIEGQIGSAAVVELLAKIGRKSDEGSFKAGEENPPVNPNDPSTMNGEQAQARIKELQQDTTFMAKYSDKNNPGHADALKMMEALYARASSTGKK